jgi:hypothetical protein
MTERLRWLRYKRGHHTYHSHNHFISKSKFGYSLAANQKGSECQWIMGKSSICPCNISDVEDLVMAWNQRFSRAKSQRLEGRFLPFALIQMGD